MEMSLSASEASGVVKFIGPPLLHNPDVPGLADSSSNTGSLFTFVLDFDILTLGGLCFLALGLTITLGLVTDCCLTSLLLACVVRVSMFVFFIRLPVMAYGVTNFFFGLCTT